MKKLIIFYFIIGLRILVFSQSIQLDLNRSIDSVNLLSASCNVSVSIVPATNSLTCDGAIVLDFSSCSGFPYDIIFSTNCTSVPVGITNITTATYTLGALCGCPYPIDMVIFNGSNEEYYVTVNVNSNVSTLVVEKEKDNRVLITPNPSSDFLKIKSNISFDEIRIKNSYGSIVESFENNNKLSFDIRNISPGMYFMELYQEGKLTGVIKIIISR